YVKLARDHVSEKRQGTGEQRSGQRVESPFKLHGLLRPVMSLSKRAQLSIALDIATERVGHGSGEVNPGLCGRVEVLDFRLNVFGANLRGFLDGAVNEISPAVLYIYFRHQKMYC